MFTDTSDHNGPTSSALASIRHRVVQACLNLQWIEMELQKLQMGLAEPASPMLGTAIEIGHASMQKHWICGLKNGRLDVRVGGERVVDKDDAGVFVQVLARLGFERAQGCNLVCCGQPLVSRVAPRRRSDGYPCVRECEGWFVVTHSSTKAKLGYLQQVLDALDGPTPST